MTGTGRIPAKRGFSSKVATRGFLQECAQTIISGAPLKPKLKTPQLERIAQLLGLLQHQTGDLYKALFEDKHQVYTLDKDEVSSEDLMWFVIMDHLYARGYYWAPDGRATTDTIVNNSVPLAFLGAKRVCNKTYESWYPGDDALKDETVRCDIFLPHGLNSLQLNLETGEFNIPERAGIIALRRTSIDFDVETIYQLREYSKNPLTTSRPAAASESLLDRHAVVYNRCSPLTRCLLIQSWIYNGKSRHDDQLNDYKNWDNNLPSIDGTNIKLKGYKPGGELPPGLQKFVNR